MFLVASLSLKTRNCRLIYSILYYYPAAPSGNPEIWWASLSESSPDGGDEIGFIGKKFASGFKVRFYSKEDDGILILRFSWCDLFEIGLR